MAPKQPKTSLRPKDQKSAAGSIPGGSSPGCAPDELDGCDVKVEVATSDEDLPAAEGGVA